MLEQGTLEGHAHRMLQEVAVTPVDDSLTLPQKLRLCWSFLCVDLNPDSGVVEASGLTRCWRMSLQQVLDFGEEQGQR